MSTTHDERPGADGTHGTQRRPGEWPATPAGDALLRQVRRERARRELTLGAIRADLEEQPSPRAIRACARRWERAIGQLADDVIEAKGAAA